MRITTRDVFQRKTPAGLAAVAETTGAADPAGEESEVGEVPLTPIMRRFDEQGMLAGRYAQSVVVPVPAGLNGARLTAGLQAVLDRHDMLRGRLVDGPCLEVREAGAVAAGGCIRRVDATGLDTGALRQALAEQSRTALDRLDPRAGEMVRAVWLDRGPGRTGHLLLVVHHLVVDGVSWRIIVPDLTAAWQAIAEGRAPRLDPVPTSFGRWARLLAERAEDQEELPLWTRTLTGPDPLLGRRPLDPRQDTVAALGRTSVTLPAEKTAPLLADVAAAYGTGVHEVLLAGLAVAVARWRRTRGVRHTALLVDVEGHGREPLTDDVDLSRTVGWFTAVHPVRLDPGAADLTEAREGGRAAGEVVKRVKEQLRALPRGGLGHGLLRHLNPRTATELAAYAAPQVAFNYLGRFDTEDATGTVDLAAAWDGTLPPTHTLEVTALVHADGGGPRLQLSLAWVPGALDEPDVTDLADEWLAALDGIGAHAAHVDAGGLTPSDVALVSLTQGDLEDLEAEYGAGPGRGGAR
jgi:non-ribosomal peptide synthase protein (TIGR01720 family)